MNIKKEIIEIVNKIENEKVLMSILSVVKIVYKQYILGEWDT